MIVMDGVTVICYKEKTFFKDRKEAEDQYLEAYGNV